MPDSYTTNLNMTKPEVGGSRDTWGTKVNSDLDILDAIFAAAGNGTSVGLNVGSGKTLNVAGTAVISGTAQFADGSAAAPTIAHSGDTNTGVFFPAADTAAITTGGTERVRVDSSGNVGINNASPENQIDILNSSDPTFSLYRTSSTAGVGVGRLIFDGQNAASARATYGRIQAEIVDSTTGSHDGRLVFATTTAGALTQKAVIDDFGRFGIGTASPAARLDVGGNVAQNIVAVSASEVDCAAGNYFTKTASGALTWTVISVPASRSYAFILELTNGGTGTQTWFSGTKWPGGVAPTLTASGVDVLGFITDDGGTTWRGVQLMKDSK